MSLFDLTTDIISQCHDLRLAIDANEVIERLMQSVETALQEEDLTDAKKRLADAHAEYVMKHAKAVHEQEASRQNINRIRELQAESILAASVVEKTLNRNANQIVNGYSAGRRLLLRHIRLKADGTNRWACIHSRILARVLTFADEPTIGACSVVCSLWCHSLQYSDVHRQILLQRIIKQSRQKKTQPDLDQRIAIRIYLSDENGASSIAFDKSLAQLQSENERVAVEHEEAVTRVRQIEFEIMQLQNKIKMDRQKFGALSIVRSEQMAELSKLANRKKQLVAQTTEMDRKLSDRRFQNMEAYLQLQEELQHEAAESRRLDALIFELNRLTEVIPGQLP